MSQNSDLNTQYFNLTYSELNGLAKIENKLSYLTGLGAFFDLQDNTFQLIEEQLFASRLKFDLPTDVLNQKDWIKSLSEPFSGYRSNINRIKLTSTKETLLDIYTACYPDSQTEKEVIIPSYLPILDQIDKTYLFNPLIDPLLKIFTIYYILEQLQPFFRNSGLIIRIYIYILFNHHHLHLFGLNQLETFVFNQKKFSAFIITELQQQSITERLNRDITNFLEICLEGYNKMIDSITDVVQKALMDTFKSHLIDDAHQNAFQYFIFLGFEKRLDVIKGLNTIQADILYYIVLKYQVTLNESVEIFHLKEDKLYPIFDSLVDFGLLLGDYSNSTNPEYKLSLISTNKVPDAIEWSVV